MEDELKYANTVIIALLDRIRQRIINNKPELESTIVKQYTELLTKALKIREDIINNHK